MAHFALIDASSIVRDTIVIANGDAGGGTFPASEPIGQAFIGAPHPDGLALEGNWLQTSYSGSFRGVFGQIGFSYDPVLDVFMPPATPEATP
jgi:hypothetical protein